MRVRELRAFTLRRLDPHSAQSRRPHLLLTDHDGVSDATPADLSRREVKGGNVRSSAYSMTLDDSIQITVEYAFILSSIRFGIGCSRASFPDSSVGMSGRAKQHPNPFLMSCTL